MDQALAAYDGEQILVQHGVGLSRESHLLYQLTTLGSSTLRFNFPAMHYGEGPLDATVNLADGNWHFVAATFDSRLHVARLYDNGRLLKSKRVMESIAGDETPTHTYIGCRGYGEFHFNGDVGELLIYNRAISARESPGSTRKPVVMATSRTRTDSWQAITSTKAGERPSPISRDTGTTQG